MNNTKRKKPNKKRLRQKRGRIVEAKKIAKLLGKIPEKEYTLTMSPDFFNNEFVKSELCKSLIALELDMRKNRTLMARIESKSIKKEIVMRSGPFLNRSKSFSDQKKLVGNLKFGETKSYKNNK